MPSPTYTFISKAVLTGTQATVTLNSIPQTFTDLQVLVSARSDRVSPDTSLVITLNSSTTNYSLTRMYNFTGGSTPGTSNSSAASQWGLSYALVGVDATTTNSFTNGEIYLPNYTGSTFKSASITNALEGNSAGSPFTILAVANLLQDTSPITSITFANVGAFNFVANSSFYLYGIKNS